MYSARLSALWSQPVAFSIGKGRSKRVMRAPIVALGAAVALLVAGLILAVANERAYQAQKIGEVTVEARLLSVLVSSALDFNDRGAAREYLEALRANPEAQAGAIYDAQDKLFASYGRKHVPTLPATPPPPGAVVRRQPPDRVDAGDAGRHQARQHLSRHPDRADRASAAALSRYRAIGDDGRAAGRRARHGAFGADPRQ